MRRDSGVMERYGKIDLHLHLDGSLSAETIFKLAHREHVKLPADTADGLRPYLTAKIDCGSLNEYLKCFDLPLAVLKTAENLELAAYELGSDLAKKGLRYGEIRFAPQLHGQKGLRQEEAVQAVLAGLGRAEAESRMGMSGKGSLADGNPDRAEAESRMGMSEKGNLADGNPDRAADGRHGEEKRIGAGVREGICLRAILCCMRGTKLHEANLETVRVASRYLGKGVVAVDLAGAEALYPTGDYEEEFRYARSLGVPFTIHAGEADGAASIWKALELGAVRIGHGIRAIEDEKLMEELARRETVLELCPTSNLQTKAAGSLSEYPLRRFLDRGIKATVNSDNMTVSDTWVGKEFALLSQEYGLTEDEAGILLENAERAAFGM